MTIRGGFRNVIKILSTTADAPPTRASIIDEISEVRPEVIFRGIEAGPGIVVDVVDTDTAAATPWKRIRISATGGTVGGQRGTYSEIWSSGTTTGPTVTVSNVFSAASPSTVYAKDVDVYVNGIRLYWESGKTLATGNHFDVSGYDLVLSTANMGYELVNGDYLVVTFQYS